MEILLVLFVIIKRNIRLIYLQDKLILLGALHFNKTSCFQTLINDLTWLNCLQQVINFFCPKISWNSEKGQQYITITIEIVPDYSEF